ncbi:MAG TPA: restriction endonuclease [Saprospiraceae bacterium]|nr:restriction endonuclease [Saprospiraceae bacterium]
MGNIYYLSSAEIIIFLSNMDFHQQDIRQFLQESIPIRFRQLGPPAFEDFIRYLFEVDGYDIVPARQTGEFEGMIIAKKEYITLVIMPLRKNPAEVLGDEVVTKAIKAKEFLNTDQSWIITTSSFDPATRELAEESDIELWDWDALYGALCQLFFEGKNHLEYLEEHMKPVSGEERAAELKLKVKWQATEGVGTEWFNLGLTIMNPTDRNIYLHLELPALIDQKRNQIMADQWVDGEFVSGLIYAGASVRTNALFSVAKLGDRPSGGRIVLTCHERVDVPLTYHLQAKLQGQACYIVTYCYSTRSEEYIAMTNYRDQVLARSIAGRSFVNLYYFISPLLVSVAKNHSSMDKLLRRIAFWSIPRIINRISSRNIR